MKFPKNITNNIILCALGTILFSGCGGGSSSSTTPTSQEVSGIVTDPAIKGATVNLYNAQGSVVGSTATSGSDGKFTISGAPVGELKDYKITASGGIDTSTGEDLAGIELSLPMGLFKEDKYKEVVVSTITSLVSANPAAPLETVAKQLGHSTDKLTLDPESSAPLLKTSMKIMLMLKEGESFLDIYSGLAGDNGIDSGDLANILNTDTKERLTRHFSLIDTANSTQELKQAYQEALILRTTRLSLAGDLAALETPDQAVISTNLHNLATHLIAHLPSGVTYLQQNDVVATISAGNGFLSAEELNDPLFNASRFVVKIVDRNATFSDTLKLAFYNVENPLTGNDQLVAYDAAKNEQKVIKTDIILGNRAFVFDGSVEGDKTVFNSRKYGIFLDPSQSKETRTAPDGRGGQFEYDFYFNNSFKRYNITSPDQETVIYDSNKLPQGLKDQGMEVLNGDYTLFNNISDADNSYVELVAFEELADTLKNESPSSKLHTPLVIRMLDSAAIQGHMIKIIKDVNGKTESVLTFFEAVHKKGTYPSDAANKKRLRLCTPDLSSCEDISGGDGKYYLQASNDAYIYMAKEGSDTLYAYNKVSKSLSAVTGVKYPANFNHKIHNVGSAGHGSGRLSNGFANLSGANNALSDGQNAYIKINYDGDASDSVGSYRFLGAIHVFKHFQILKLTGTTGVKMFDNGDGVDHADESDSENVVGHGNLIAVNNGKLFVEIGNYEGATDNGGTCTPNSFGYGCSSVEYGYLNTSSVGKTKLDTTLHPKKLLRYFVSRRIAPFALGDELYISIFKGSPSDTVQPYVFTLNEHSLASPDVANSSTDGRSYFTKTAERDNGVYEGAVIIWDGATGQLKNLTTGITLGQANGSGSVIPGDPAILSVSALTRGVPLAGIGNLFAVKADPGNHTWYLQAGDTNEANGLEYIDRVPFSLWLYQ